MYGCRTPSTAGTGAALAVALVVVGAAGGPALVWAQAPARSGAGAVVAPSEELPAWDEGVSPEQRSAARALLAEGNRLIKVPLFAQAAAKYREALAAWDHPALHYNLGIAQLNLVRLTEAYESFQESLRHGPGPLGQEKFEQARAYLALLETRLARVEVVCNIAGAEVALDGERLFIGPGAHEHVVSPGRHQLVASAAGHVPDTEQIALSPGERVRYVLVPRSLDDMARRERRWAVWKPWAAVVAGAGLIAGAGYLDARSSRGFDRFDEGFEAECLPRGCQGSEIVGLVAQKDAAEVRQGVALGLYVAGGTALAVGAALVYFNRERLVERNQPSGIANVSVAPMVTPSGGGVSATVQF
jgi:uncharacterized membrane protein